MWIYNGRKREEALPGTTDHPPKGLEKYIQQLLLCDKVYTYSDRVHSHIMIYCLVNYVQFVSTYILDTM